MEQKRSGGLNFRLFGAMLSQVRAVIGRENKHFGFDVFFGHTISKATKRFNIGYFSNT